MKEKRREEGQKMERRKNFNGREIFGRKNRIEKF
jgi:hypothetical protein